MSISKPIGVFDSGVGGLSVLRHLLKLMPDEHYIYLGDTARVPYGNKSPETVQLYSKECTQFLLNHDVKMIIIACNTASALALEHVQLMTTIPVLGVIIPSATAALHVTRNKTIGVLATRATITSQAHSKALLNLASDIAVIAQPCPLFVPLAEEGWIAHPATRAIAEEYVKPLKRNAIDTAILGCTHYPLLHEILTDVLPGVTLIDPGEQVAKQAYSILYELNILASKREVPSTALDFYVTDIPSTFSQVAKQFLGFDFDQPQLVSIDHLASL